MVYGFTNQPDGKAHIRADEGEPAPEASPDASTAASTGTPRTACEGNTALVVDDEPFVAMLITDVLEDIGCAWIDAPDGATALDALRSKRRIDLLISDIGLPGGMNGRQLAEAARALRPGLKILFVTGYAQGNPSGEGIQVITKPFAIETLTARIQSMLAAP